MPIRADPRRCPPSATTDRPTQRIQPRSAIPERARSPPVPPASQRDRSLTKQPGGPWVAWGPLPPQGSPRDRLRRRPSAALDPGASAAPSAGEAAGQRPARAAARHTRTTSVQLDHPTAILHMVRVHLDRHIGDVADVRVHIVGTATDQTRLPDALSVAEARSPRRRGCPEPAEPSSRHHHPPAHRTSVRWHAETRVGGSAEFEVVHRPRWSKRWSHSHHSLIELPT